MPGCYRPVLRGATRHRMTKPAIAGPGRKRGRDASPRAGLAVPALAGLTRASMVIVSLALAGCATIGTPPPSEKDEQPLTPSQSNLTSLSEVVEKHPDDPQ